MIPAGQLNHRKSVKHPKHVPSPKISLSHNMLLCFSKWVIASLQRGNLPVCRLKLAASCLQDLRWFLWEQPKLLLLLLLLLLRPPPPPLIVLLLLLLLLLLYHYHYHYYYCCCCYYYYYHHFYSYSGSYSDSYSDSSTPTPLLLYSFLPSSPSITPVVPVASVISYSITRYWSTSTHLICVPLVVQARTCYSSCFWSTALSSSLLLSGFHLACASTSLGAISLPCLLPCSGLLTSQRLIHSSTWRYFAGGGTNLVYGQ